MFTNDIINSINTDLNSIFTINQLKIFLLLFADDAVLFAHSPETLQSMLNDMQHYCHTWGLTINRSKTQVMVFERGRGTTFNIFLNDTQLFHPLIIWELIYLKMDHGTEHKSELHNNLRMLYPKFLLFPIC